MEHKDYSMTFASRLAPLAALLVTAAACGSSADEPTTQETTTQETGQSAETETVRSIANQGGAMEGHTPRGFAGSGVGLFAGDNLNQGFPEGEGVQIWLTFELDGVTEAPASAVLRSDVLSISGDPFDTLGELNAAPVTFAAFGPELFDLEPDGAASSCARVGETGIECDVSTAVAEAVEAGASTAQFRLRFEQPADNDGEQDLAKFFLTDSNTNEPGIFTLDLAGSSMSQSLSESAPP